MVRGGRAKRSRLKLVSKISNKQHHQRPPKWHSNLKLLYFIKKNPVLFCNTLATNVYKTQSVLLKLTVLNRNPSLVETAEAKSAEHKANNRESARISSNQQGLFLRALKTKRDPGTHRGADYISQHAKS